MILATRPTLLHVFQAHRELWFTAIPRVQLKEAIGETALALAEACIRCARHSHRILTDSWIDGSFAIFDYTYTQYLFSSATILAISSLTIGQAEQDDRDYFESACHFLEQLRENGNFAAREFCEHLDAMRSLMAVFSSTKGDATPHDVPDRTCPDTFPAHSTALSSAIPTPVSGFQPMMTAEMALAEPSLQDFLSQEDLDLSFLDTQIQDSRFQSLYIPAPLPDEDWTRR